MIPQKYEIKNFELNLVTRRGLKIVHEAFIQPERRLNASFTGACSHTLLPSTTPSNCPRL